MTLVEYLHSQFSMAQYADFLARLAIACICGAGIGLERFARIVGAPGRGRATLDGTVLVLEGQTSAVLREEGR